MRRLIAPMAAAALATAALPASASPAPAPSGNPRPAPLATAPAIRWATCPVDVAAPAVECGTLRVPLDHDRPAAGTTEIALARTRATGPGPRRGSILVNPGGPGGGGMWLADVARARLPAEITRAYDIVGVDPRGNAHSSPIRCVEPDPAPRPDPEPRTSAEVRAHLDRAAAYGRACAERSGDLVPYLSTVANAHDLDAVRAALGEDRISYLGWSYGTYLGAVYGQLHPDRVDRMILDSVVDPGGVWYAANLAQNASFQARWRDFTVWAARHHAVLRLGARPADVDDAWERVLAGVRARPASGVAGPAEVLDDAASAMYSSAAWAGFARALRAYLDGDPEPLAARYETPTAEDANATAVYTAVECNDATWPRDPGVWLADATLMHRTAPLLTWSNTWLNAPCMTWPVPSRRPLRIDGRGMPPVLLVQGTGDAATPLAGARAMHRALPGSRMVTVAGEGDHGVLVFSPNRCAEAHAVAYLRDGTLPVGDVTCPAVPEPDPATQDAPPVPADRAVPDRGSAHRVAAPGRPAPALALPHGAHGRHGPSEGRTGPAAREDARPVHGPAAVTR